MTVANVVVLGIGAILVYAGVKDVNPIQLVKDALSGKVTAPGSWKGQEPLDPKDLAAMQDAYKHPPGTKSDPGAPHTGDGDPPPSTNRADYYDQPPTPSEAYKDRFRAAPKGEYRDPVDTYQNPYGGSP